MLATTTSRGSLCDELPLHWPRYKPLRVLGEGGFGVVYLCVDEELRHALIDEKRRHDTQTTTPAALPGTDEETELWPQCLVAVKAIPLSDLSDAELVLAMNEVSLLQNISHPNILKYLDCFNDPEWQQLCLVTEYVDGGDLASLIRRHQRRRQAAAHPPRARQRPAKDESRRSPLRKRARETSAASTQDHTTFAQRVAHVPALSDTFDLDPSGAGAAAWPAPVSPPEAAGASWDSADASFFPTTPLGDSGAASHWQSSRAHGGTTDGFLWDDDNADDDGRRQQASLLSSASSSAGDEDGQGEIEWIESFLITDIVRQCLDGLAYLHSLAIVHRDVKPSNIYLTKSGTVRIGDFGVAKLLSTTDPFTRTFVGTPFYLAPEVCLGELYSFGADVWALGVVTYELYCLQLPFAASNVLAQIHLVSEGRYNHERLLTPHEFTPAQLTALHALYGEEQFDKSEAVLHSLVVSLVEQTLSVEAGTRPAAEAILMDTFGVLPSYLNLTEVSLSSLPRLAAQRASLVSDVGSAAAGWASRPSSRRQPDEDRAVPPGRRLNALDVEAIDMGQEVGVVHDVSPERHGQGAAPAAPFPTRPPLVPPSRLAPAERANALSPPTPMRGSSLSLASHSRPQSRAALLSVLGLSPLHANHKQQSQYHSNITMTGSSSSGFGDVFTPSPITSRPGSSSNAMAAAAASRLSTPGSGLQTRVQEAAGALVSCVPEGRRASVHAALHSSYALPGSVLSRSGASPPVPSSSQRLGTAQVVEEEEEDEASAPYPLHLRRTAGEEEEEADAALVMDDEDEDTAFAPWLHNGAAFSTIALRPDSDAVLLVESADALAPPSASTRPTTTTTTTTATDHPLTGNSRTRARASGVELVEFTKRAHYDPSSAVYESPVTPAAARTETPLTAPSTLTSTPSGTVVVSGPRRVSLVRALPSGIGPGGSQSMRRVSTLTAASTPAASRPSSRLRMGGLPPPESAASARVRPVSAASQQQQQQYEGPSHRYGTRSNGGDRVDGSTEELRRLSTPPPAASLPSPASKGPSPSPSPPPPLNGDLTTTTHSTETEARPDGAALSTAQLEQLLRAKLLAHHAQRHKHIQAQRQQQATLEAVRARLRTQLAALYNEALVQQLPTTGADLTEDARATRPSPAPGTTPPTITTTSPAATAATRPASAVTVATTGTPGPGSPVLLEVTQRPAIPPAGVHDDDDDDEDAFAATTTLPTDVMRLARAALSVPSTRPPSADVLDATVRRLLECQPPPAALSHEPVRTTATTTIASTTVASAESTSVSGTAPVVDAAGSAAAAPNRLQQLWATEAAAQLTHEALNAAAVARWRSTFAAQPPRRLVLAPAWLPPRRDGYFAELWESSSVEDDAEEVTEAGPRAQCAALLQASAIRRNRAAHALSGEKAAVADAATVVCYREGLRRGRQKPVRPPASALEKVPRWRWSCPPSSCDESDDEDEDEEGEDETSSTSSTSGSEPVPVPAVTTHSSRQRVVQSAHPARAPRHPHSRRESGVGSNKKRKETPLATLTRAPKQVPERRAASAPDSGKSARSTTATAAPIRPRPLAVPTAQVVATPASSGTTSLFILKGIGAAVDQKPLDDSFASLSLSLHISGTDESEDAQDEDGVSDRDEEESPTAISSATSSTTSSSSSTGDDDDEEEEDDDEEEEEDASYMYTALYYTPETLPETPATVSDTREEDAAVRPPAGMRRHCRFFDYTLPVTLVLTSSVPGTKAPRKPSPSAAPTPPLDTTKTAPKTTTAAKDASHPSRTAQKQVKSPAPRPPAENAADLTPPPPPPLPWPERAVSAETASTAMARAPVVSGSDVFSVVGTKLPTHELAEASKPDSARPTKTAAAKPKVTRPPPAQTTKAARKARPASPAPVPTRYLRANHRSLPITLALRPLHDRTRLSGLLWRVLFSLSQCQLDMPLFASALAPAPQRSPRERKADGGALHSPGTAPLVLLPASEEEEETDITETSVHPSQRRRPATALPRVCRPAVRTPLHGGVPLREQMALYFYEPHSPLPTTPTPALSVKNTVTAKTTASPSAGPLCIRLDSEEAWKEVRQLWATHYARRAFMRLYLVVPEGALEPVE